MRLRKKDAETATEPDKQPSVAAHTGRKRRASNASDAQAQDVADTVQTTQSTKRRKRARSPRPDKSKHPQLESVQDVAEDVAMTTELTSQGTTTVYTEEKQVRFTESVVGGMSSSATNITPHPRQKAADRRMTMSPATAINLDLADSSMSKRKSLPAQVLAGSPDRYIATPVRPKVELSKLIARRIAKKTSPGNAAEVADWDNDTLAQRNLLINDDQMLLHEPTFDDSPPADDALVAITEAALDAAAVDQSIIEDRTAWMEHERVAYKEEIKQLGLEIGNIRPQLAVLVAEAHSLGFGDQSVPAGDVLELVRRTFEMFRANAIQLSPEDTDMMNLSNAELLTHFLDKFRGLQNTIITQDDDLANAHMRQTDSQSQINELVDVVAEFQRRCEGLEISKERLQDQLEIKTTRIDTLEHSQSQLKESNTELVRVINSKDADLAVARDEHVELEDVVTGLEADLAQLTTTHEASKAKMLDMQANHDTAVLQNQEQHAQHLESLATEILEAGRRLTLAIAESDDKQAEITQLELDLEKARTELDTAALQIIESKTIEANLRMANELLETDVSTKIVNIETLQVESEGSVQRILELEALNKSQMQQREAAETELDERIEEAAQLTAKNTQHGIEANELRQKLFEAQIRSDEDKAKIEEYEEAIRVLNIDIAAVALQLTQSQTDLAAVTLLKDSADQEHAIAHATLTAELQQTLDEKDQQELSSNVQITALEQSLADHQAEIVAHTATILELERNALSIFEAHTTELAQRDARIMKLDGDVLAHTQQISGLEHDKQSLEQRVEAEAEAMLELQGRSSAEIADLQSQIRAKQAENSNLSNKAQNVDAAWRALVEENETITEALHVTVTDREHIIAGLSDDNVKMREIIKKYVKESNHTNEALRIELELLRQGADKAHEEHKRAGDAVMQEIEMLYDQGVARGRHIETVKVIKKTKKTTKKSSPGNDSAIGADDSPAGNRLLV